MSRRIQTTVIHKHPSTIHNHEDFPMLMENREGDMIVYMTGLNADKNLGSGLVLRRSKNTTSPREGDFSKSWLIDNFRPFEGKVELTNK